jgi:hypothetical protein
LDTTTYLFGRANAEPSIFTEGTYDYNFNFNLPTHLPESLKASKGSIHYTLEVFLDVAWGIDEKIKKHLTIVRNDNLNLYPELKTPMNQRELHTFRWFSLKNGFCSFSITIPHRGFSSGQAIPVKMEINNMSKVDIAKTKVTLKTISTFTCFKPEKKSKIKTETLVELIVAGVKKSGKNSQCCLKNTSKFT